MVLQTRTSTSWILFPDQKRFGGELLKTRLPEGDHFYNRIDGVRFDFTESQFVRPIACADAPTPCDDAERGITSAELAALRTAFLRHAGASD